VMEFWRGGKRDSEQMAAARTE